MAETTEKEKMRALQKAYAETILNTAKEAAARIMSSERKAHEYHRHLSSTKDEALRLLLRLKHSFHAQINEAEMKSLNQQRRIEELEAQLQEAEDIVSNLRAELIDAHLKLEEMANNQINHALNMSEKVGSDYRLLEADLAAKTNLINNFDDDHYAAHNFLEENGHSGHPLVPSIIMRSKEPELYRNGCTQRIRACEGNLVNCHFPLSGESDDPRDEKAIREDKEGEGKQGLEMKSTSVYPVFQRKKRKNKRRAARYVTQNPIRFLAKEVPSVLPDSHTCLPSSHDMHEGSDNKVKGTHVHSPSTVPPNVSEMDVLAGHLVRSQGDEAETCMVASEDTKTASTLVLIRKPSGSEDCLDDSNLKQDLELKDFSSVIPDSKQLKAGDGFASLPPKDRFLKYTFQRKRKRESSSGDDMILQQENSLKRRIVKKQNDNIKGPESSVVAESSRDSRRMAQVARQLISLSEKKAWK